MTHKKWKESPWIGSLKLLKRLPFEDGVFNSIYRAVLLRNVEFCKVITNEDRTSCIRMTNKFIHQAILVAFGVNNEEISIKELVKNMKKDYDLEKEFYFFYIVYNELIRRNNTISYQLLKELRACKFQEPFKSLFRSFEAKLAWDFLLFDLAHQKLNENMFAILWFRYRKSLLKCRAKEYREFVYKEYLKDIKNKTEFTRRKPEKDVYTSMIQRAERRYSDTEIFEEL